MTKKLLWHKNKDASLINKSNINFAQIEKLIMSHDPKLQKLYAELVAKYDNVLKKLAQY